ncbi:MAG TPA: hypothetical protein VNJ01_04020 [Bacteriovoracaceae bacterium]|nr:hypothetical protein [Bacteriovoracaceae bacterium]
MKWLSFFLLLSCAQVTSLNLRKHQFGILPTKIIWFQVAGLEMEQLAMLRFQKSGETKTSFEQNICLGSTWNYNFYQLRNNAQTTFLSQMTGKKNIAGGCEDTQHRPIWSYIKDSGYSTGVLEIGASEKQNLSSLNKCGENGLVFLSHLYYWIRSNPPADAQTFHFSEGVPAKPNQLLYDRTCGASGCTSSILENFQSVYLKLRRSTGKHLFVVRDFSYLTALENKDFTKAREILADLERTYADALKFTRESNDFLVLLTSGDSRFIDMPDQGKNWFEYEKTNKNVQVRRTKLTNMVLASGSRAENFCGIYDDSQIFDRILSGPKEQGLELKIINPFKK